MTGVLDHQLGLQVVVGQVAAASAAPAEVEQHHVVVPGQRLDARDEVPVTDVRAAVHDHHGRQVAADPELPDEQRHVTEVDQPSAGHHDSMSSSRPPPPRPRLWCLS